MVRKDTFLGKYLPVIFALLVAILGLATSWGMAKGEITGLKTTVEDNKGITNSLEERIRKIEVDNAGDRQILKNILFSLEEIKKEIKELDKNDRRQ